jgi:hypothetical protein
MPNHFNSIYFNEEKSMKTYHFKKIILFSILLGLSQVSWAANFYVRNGASGSNNGSDWTNAWSDMSKISYSSINPGDTIYFAVGTYGGLRINKSGTSGNPITFKRATVASHGADTGWSASYDGRVIIDGGIEVGITIDAHYITIDGATRYGIWSRKGSRGIGTRNGGRANNLTLRYIETGDPGTYKNNEDGIQGIGDNLLVEYCYVHDNDSTVTHGDGIQWFQGNNITLRYNVFKNNGQQTMLGEAAWSTYANDVNIYYNVFYNRGGTHYNGITAHAGSPEAGRYFRIYNNTIDLEANSADGTDSLFNMTSPKGTVDFRNNAVVYTNVAAANQSAHSYNAYDNNGSYADYNIPTETSRVVAADLGFTNINSADYHLTSLSPLIGKGTNVGLTQDFDGKPVPAIPSIGAFELNNGSATVVTLMAPSNLKIVP